MKKRLFVLLLTVFSLSCSVIAQPKAVAYLIPEGFTGGVIVLYKQADGITPEIAKDGTVLYPIPKDGFLKVNTDFPPDNYIYNFYYVNTKNDLTPLEYVQLAYYVRAKGDTTTKTLDTLTEDERNNKIFVMSHRTIGFKVKDQSVPLYAFSVGYPKNANSYSNKTNFRLSDIEDELSKKQP
jgi:hypothetical protein